MSSYRAHVRYQFKKGMEEQGLKYIETELVKKAKTYGCHYLELWQNEKDSSYVLGIAVWNSIEEAREFQSQWESKEKELMRYCSAEPKHEFFKLRSSFTEKAKKAA